MIRGGIVRVEAAEVTRLATLDQLKFELGDSGSDNDTKYGNALDYCSNEISLWLNGAFAETGDVTIGRETVAETLYEVCDARDVVLGRMPVGDIVSVTEGGVEIPRTIEDEANPAFPYVVSKSAGILRKISGGRRVPFAGDVMVVTYSAGWLLPGQEGRNLPKAIEDACLRFARVKLDQVEEGEDLAGPLTAATVQGVGNFQFGGTSAASKGKGLPYDVRNLIERYKAPVLA